MAVSFDKLRDDVRAALNEKLAVDEEYGLPWISELYDEYVIAEVDELKYFQIPYTYDGETVTISDRDQWTKVKPERVWSEAKARMMTAKNGNALKAISKTDDELRVANYIVMFGGRDLEGLASPRVNPDGSRGEYFTPETQLDSEVTKTGQLPVDWEHGTDGHPDAPKRDDVFGYVDWKTAVTDKLGVWVERVLDRRNQYIQYLEQLIDAGLIGNSSEAIPGEVEKAEDGRIKRWPLARDTLTVTPMEPRMITQNALTALKALGVVLPESTGAETPDKARNLAIAKAKARLRLLELSGGTNE